MNKFCLKTKEFFKTHRDHFLSAAFVIVIFNLILAISGSLPYGENTVLMGDSLSQIGTFFDHIFNVFEGKSTLFYSNYVGSGVEIFSTIEYMYLNPFYLIVLIFGRKNIFCSIHFSIMFMLAFNAIVFIWFANKHFKNVGGFVKVVLALIYAFSPYVAANFIFVSWLIYPGIILILFDKFLKLVHEGKILGFVCTMVWYVITCFSVGVSTNIILIVVFSAYIFFTKSKEEQRPIFVRLLVAYLLAVLLCIVILFPALVAFLRTYRAGTSIAETFSQKFNNFWLVRFGTIALGGILLVFVGLYLFKCNKKEGKNKFYIFALVLTTVAIVFGVITKLLLGGQSNGLFYRFSFINLALIFIVVLEFFNAKFEFIQKEANYMKLYSILFYSYIFVYLLVFVWWCVACFTKYLDGLKAFPIAEGFMVMTLVLFAVMLVGVAITILIYKKGLVGKKYLNIFASVALGITLISNIVSIGTGLGDKTTFNNLQYHTTMLDNNSKIKIYNSNFIDKNVNSLNLGVKTGSFFSSLVSNETVQSYKTLGYSISSVHADSWLGNIVSDSLMGYRYVLAYEEMNRPYLKLVSMEEDFYVYENTLATTGAVFLPEGFEYNANASVFENLTALKNAFGIEGELVKDVVISSEEITEFDQNFASFITKYTYTANADQILYINKNVITLQREGNEEFNAYFDNLLKSENIYYIESFVDAGSIRDLMFVEAGKTVEFYVCNVETGSINEAVEFKTVDYNVAKNICESLQARSAKINYTKDGYEVSFAEGQTGKLLVLCPDIAGMNYKLNDSSIDAIHEFGYFSVFEIADSTSKITATYRFAEGKWWIVVTFLMIALIVLVSVLYKKTQFKFMEKATQIGFYVANCCILVVFFLFGIILTIFRSLL